MGKHAALNCEIPAGLKKKEKLNENKEKKKAFYLTKVLSSALGFTARELH